MTLPKAIENLKLLKINLTKSGLPYPCDAIQLGIEALKRLEAWRNDNDEDLLWDLPGETKE